MENRPVSLEETVERIRDVDLIITEGGKSAGWRNILFYREGAGKPPAAGPDACAAVVTDSAMSCRAPVFSLGDAAGLADFLLRDMKKNG